MTKLDENWYREWCRDKYRLAAKLGIIALLGLGTSAICYNSNQKINDYLSNKNTLENKTYVQKLESRKENNKSLAIGTGFIGAIGLIFSLSALGAQPGDP